MATIWTPAAGFASLSNNFSAKGIPVERRGRRAKTDRIDLDMLLRTLLAWLRGEPRVCSIVRIPSEAEEDMRRPERERERLVSERVALENRIENLLCPAWHHRLRSRV